MATTNGKAMAFREMHRSGCFVMANPWDRGSAVMFRHLGFKALATTSAGLAFTLALPDAVGAIPLEATLENIRQIVRATPLPVNADFQDGFSRLPEGVAQNVARCVETGVAGLSIEDATGDSDMPLYERELATERVRAARSATPLPVVLTARCEAWLVGHPDPLPTAIDRLVAYAEAGADCLYAPGVRAPDDIKAIVNAVAPKPVNVLVSTALPHSVSDLGVLGVRRISVGSALARTAWGAFMRAARSILDDGTFADFADAASFDEINRVFGAHPNEQASASG
jgi:2-methylisocitrate lyase-like PEP mutase family enzyme